MLAIRNLKRNSVRTALNIAAVSIAVLFMVLLASMGSGLIATGEQAFQRSNMHLWITGKPVDLQTKYTNPGETKINNVHTLAKDILKDPRINVSSSMLTEIVYAYKENERPKAVFGVGVATSGSMVVVSEGSNLNHSSHYHGGAYDGPWTKEVMVDSRAATILDVGVGDTIHVGKTVKDAEDQKCKIVGITNSLATFSTNPMLIFPFSEFQDISGNHYYDSASMIMIRLKNPHDADAVRADLEKQYPDYVINTNRDFLEKIIQKNSMILGSAVSMMLLAVVMGGALVINTMVISINERRREIGIMQVIGMSRWVLMKNVGMEGLIITTLGGLAGCLLSVPAAVVLNKEIESMMGFNGVLVLDEKFLLWGFIMALTLGFISSTVAMWRINQINPIDLLRSV
jgi:putative ABC transport system permease protein